MRNAHEEAHDATAEPAGGRSGTVAEAWFRLRSGPDRWVMPSGGRFLRIRFHATGGDGLEAEVDTIDGVPVTPGTMYVDARLTFDGVEAGGVRAGHVFQVLLGGDVVGQGEITRVLRHG